MKCEICRRKAELILQKQLGHSMDAYVCKRCYLVYGFWKNS